MRIEPQIRNPSPRNPKEGRNPKSELAASGQDLKKSGGERAALQTLREVGRVSQSRQRRGVRRPSAAFVRTRTLLDERACGAVQSARGLAHSTTLREFPGIPQPRQRLECGGFSTALRRLSGFAAFLPLCLALILSGCATPHTLQQAFHADKLADMDVAINQAIADHKCPGGVLWVEHDGVAYHKAFGNRSLVPDVEPMTEDTIFDAASLTKVMATTPAMMLLIQRGQVKLDAAVTNYIPEFTGYGKEAITVRELMTHTSGMPPDIETKTDWHGEAEAIKMACACKLDNPPGTVFKYSDINFILLGEIVQRVSGMPLEVFVKKDIYTPLGMNDTGYLPPADEISRIAPTEVVDGKPWRGVVHDPTSRHMGGVAGHAGLFITASDTARYARMLLNGGKLDGVRVFKRKTVKLMTTVQSPPQIEAKRGLGWDIDSPYAGPRGKLFPVGSYGHTGWTGGSIWIDPYSRTFVIFLSNRNHPTEAGNVLPLRRQLGTLAAEAVTDFDFSKFSKSSPGR